MAVTYYTTPTHETATAQSVSTNTSTMNNGIDGKLNTYWSPTSADLPAWSFIVDLCEQDEGEYLAGRGPVSGSIDSIGIWFGNYNTDFTVSSIDVTQGINPAVGFVDTLYNTTAIANDGPLYVIDLENTSTKRYIKISGTSFVSVPQLNFFFCAKNSLTRSHEYRGSTKLPIHHNNTVKLQGPNDHITMDQKEPVDVYKRMYKLINATEVAWVSTVFNESRGRRNLFIINESTGQANNILCRFDKDKPVWRDPTGDYREATLAFTSIHYVRDGETL